MTFTEAALEVLRTAGEPLHYKKITELAIERNLLSHVGKTPEVTMSSRLAMMVKKDRGQAPIIKVKPGVFAIRESALQGASLSPEALAAISEVEGIEETKTAGAAGEVASTEEAVSVPPKAPALPGSDVFPEEEGDDDPILAGLEQESEGGERSGRRRRRRRRRKGEKAEGTAEAAPRAENGGQRDNQRERFRDRSRQDRQDRQERQERQDRPERQDRGERQERNERFERQAARSEERRSEERNEGARADESLDWNRQPADGDLLGKDLADAVASVLARGDRTPHTFSRVAELLVRRGRLSGSPAALSPTIAAAVRADIARAELQRARPRFRLRGARLSLSDWHLPKSLQRAEQDLLSTAERYAGELRRALIQKLSELPTAGFAELLATWLNAEGVTALRAVRRPGSSGSELHFAGTRKTGSEEVRLAIVVQRGSRDIDREAIIDVRGALHHYGQAQAAWVVTLGRITSGAREEAAAQAAACALFDGQALAAAMERLGVAVRRNVIAHHEIDYDLLESLGDSPEQRERREREQERERREHNERTRAAQRERGRSGRAPASTPQDEREVRELDDDQDERPDARPVKLRDADWDDEAVPHGAPALDDESADDADDGDEVNESLAPRGYTLRDTADDRREDGEALRLRDELESDADESADDEDFSTSEESDDEYAASDDADDDSVSDDDDADDLEGDADVDDAETDEDFRAGLDEDADTEDSDDDDDSDEADDSDDDADVDAEADADEPSDEQQPAESTGRARRR